MLRGAHSKEHYAKPGSFMAWQRRGSACALTAFRDGLGLPNGPHSLAPRAANEFVSGLNRQVRKHWFFLLEIPLRPTHEKESPKGGDGVECGPSAATTETQKSSNNQHGAAFARDKGPP